MRRITQQEAEQWVELARQHGFYDDQKGFRLGRYVVEGSEGGTIWIRFVTPVPAGRFTEGLDKKTPPIMFDRTADGQIILPGRRWQLTFEKLSADASAPDEVRAGASTMARLAQFADALLPADTDTVGLNTYDDDGTPLSTEALPPETRAVLHYSIKSGR